MMAYSRGLKIDIVGIQGLLEGLQAGQAALPEMLKATLAGEGGRAILRWNRRLIHTRTGGTVSHLGIRLHGDSVEVGYEGDLVENSGLSRGGTMARDNVGTWLESGTRMHTIRPAKKKALAFLGRVREDSVHPGSKAQRIMSKSLRGAEPEIETDLVIMAGRLANWMHFSGEGGGV